MRTKETYLCIKNETPFKFTTSVSATDSYDWDSNSGPQRNFNNITINPQSEVTKREEVRRSAKNCPFTMTIKFTDGSFDTFRINQKHAINDAGPSFNHSSRSHEINYWRSGKTLYISVKLTHAQQEELLAEQLRKDASAKLQQKLYEQALKKLEEALRHANQATTKTNLIKDQANIYYQDGMSSLDEALELERKGKAEDADRKLNDAKAKIQKANSLHNNPTYQRNIDLINLKMEANKIFNDALKREKEAYDLFINARKSGIFDDYTSAQNAYKEASAKYEEALKKFEAGAKINSKLAECVNVVKEQIRAVGKVVDDIDKAELIYNIGQIEVVNADDANGKTVSVGEKDDTIKLID